MRLTLSLLCAVLLTLSCKKNGVVLPPGRPGVDTTKTPAGDTGIAAMFDSTRVIVWIEAAANFARMGTAEKMSAVFQQLADMGAKGVVVDVKGITGLVNYHSSLATQLKTWNGYTQADGFDYLQNMITEAKKKGLRVFASMSVFGEGMNYYGTRMGKVFSDPDFDAMQSQVVTAAGDVKKITDVYAYGLLNPLLPKAQGYELSLIRELVSNYAIDGFVLDYCRYYGIVADFSDYSLGKFKEWLGVSSVSRTDIVQSWTNTNGEVQPGVTGPLYNKWLEFRSQTIRDFVARARDTVKSVKPGLAFCSYSGAWYDTYYYVGVNWASKQYDPSADGYSWASAGYKNTGYAELLDMFMTGNYTATLTGAGWWTVQGEINGAKRVLKDANIHFGSVDIGNTTWANLQNMKDAMRMILDQTGGLMLFDVVHIDDPTFNQFGKPLYGDIRQVIKK